MDELDFSPTRLVRNVLENYLVHGEIPELPETEIKAGAFVTLKNAEDEELRGCIGTIEPSTDLVTKEIAKNAVSSATNDPRFPSVSREELDNIKISVDILGKKEPVDDVSQLDPERYGVVVEKGQKRGVLLPDLEGVDTASRQLEIACRKAGISPGELDDIQASIYRFPVRRYEEEF